MDEDLVNGTQTAGAASEEVQANGNGRLDVESLRRLRLIEFLRELVRAEGRVEAAKLLGVNYKTLVRAEESGQITGRMGDALERLLLSQGGPAEQPDPGRVGELEVRVAALEAGLESMATEMRDSLEDTLALVEDREGVRDDGDQDQERGKKADRAEVAAGTPVAGTPVAGTPVAGSHRPKPAAEPRVGPQVVTEKPADDDPVVYGKAWPLVEKWRRLRASHPNEGTSLSWLAAEEKLLKLELAMLDEHGLTLPPETQPLRGFARRGQTSWRRTALDDTRKARGKRRLLRVLALGLWWR